MERPHDEVRPLLNHEALPPPDLRRAGMFLSLRDLVATTHRSPSTRAACSAHHRELVRHCDDKIIDVFLCCCTRWGSLSSRRGHARRTSSFLYFYFLYALGFPKRERQEFVFSVLTEKCRVDKNSKKERGRGCFVCILMSFVWTKEQL